MKRVGWIVIVAIIVLTAYKLSHRSQRVAESETAPAPVAGTWEIKPANPQASVTLEVRLAGSRGAVETQSCRWFRNGVEIEDEHGPTLAPGRFERGDEITAEVVGTPGAPAQHTAAVTILNSAPRIVAASADLQTEPSAQIHVQVSTVDADDDDLALTYQWYRNGDPMPGETGATVKVSRFEMGDEAYAMVTASDGIESSGAEKSDPIRIGSNAPDITSTPPAALEPGRRFVYQVQVRTEKPKSIRYQLLDAPDGMTIDETGLIEWTMPALEGTAHTYEVAIKVSDPTGGEAVQRFQLNASVQRSSNE